MKKIFLVCLISLCIFIPRLFAQDESHDLEKTINLFNSMGFDYQKEGNYDSAEFYLLKTILLKESFYGKNSYEAAATHLNIASLYRYKYDFKRAIEHLNLAEEIYKELDPESIYLSYVYHNKANIYFNYEDYAEAKRYYKYSIDLFKRLNATDTESYALAFSNYTNSILGSSQSTNLDSIVKELNNLVYDEENLFYKHYYLSEIFERKGDIDQAFNELELASKVLKRNPFSAEEEIKLHYKEAQLYFILDDTDAARKALYKNMDILEKHTKYHIRQLNVYYLLCNSYFLDSDFETCYNLSTTAINKYNSEESKLNNFSKKYTGIINSKFYPLYWIGGKAAYGLYTTKHEQKYLEISLQNYSQAINRINQSKLNMKNEQSIILSTETKIDIFHEAINVAIELYKLTNDIEYLWQSFEYTESSKSFALLSEIKGLEAMEFSGIPSELKDEEERLDREISAYEEILFNEESKEFPDSVRLSNFQDELFNLRDDYNTLLDEIENSYPDYFALKYNPHFATLDEISAKQHRNEAIVEYVLSDTLLTTFIIDPEHTVVLQQPIDSSFAEECITYYTLLQSQEFDKDVHETYSEYVRLSRLFYETLVAPVREVTDKREITFVPDGELMYLPFEAFLTRDVDNVYINYMELPYLIHELSVAYSYSSTLLFSERIKTKSPEKKVLAFAPSYENLMNVEDPLSWNRKGNPDYLIPLMGAKEEVNNISKRVPSIVFRDTEASEYNFKKYASDYSILHLAMHTIMNDEDPMFSRLAFTRDESDTLEDNDLFTYEIYNMKLNASMIVLSSCSSGYGKMQRGEGMMSLARGFIYAGCPSIVMTLWQVSDRSSADLMSSFYKFLKRGKSKKEALRLAKIEYIKNSDGLKANPYFWSGFVEVGDSSPLYRKTATFYWVTIITGFVLLVFFFQYRNKLRKVIRKQ